MFKKINLLMLAFIVLISLLPAKVIKVAAAFNEGSAYQEGKYKETAQHPLETSWSKNSKYASVNAKKATEIFHTDSSFSVNPLVDEDGTIYIATAGSPNELFALNSDGSVKWKREMESNKPVIGMAIYTNGDLIYNDSRLNMVDAETGKDVWDKPVNIGATGNDTGGVLFKGSPVIDKDGHIIVPHVNGVYAFNGNGSLLSSITNSSNSSNSSSHAFGVTIASDGTIYYPYNRINSYKLENNQLLEKYERYYTGESITNDTITLIDNDKLVYDVPNSYAKIINLKDQSTIPLEPGKSYSGVSKNSTVYSKDKSIYVPFNYSLSKSGFAMLNKYNENGSLLWSQPLEHRAVSSPIIDSQGNVIVVEKGTSHYLTSISKDKDANWTVELGETTEGKVDPIPVITKDGSIIVMAFRSLYKVTGDINDSNDSNDPGTVDPEPEPTPEPEEKPETKLITVFNETNKYDTSSFNDKSNNTVYEYTEKKDDWYKIITAPNHTKWINSTNVIEGEIDGSEQTVSITRDSFGYSKPFFYSKKTDDILKKDTEVKTYGKIGDWYVTKVDGKNVWFNQDEIKLTTFAPNKLYKEPDLSTSTGGIAQPQTLNVKDIQITTNTDYWYKVQSWLGDVYTLGEQAGFGSIQTVSQSFNAKDIKAFDTPFTETSTRTLNSEVTLVGKWQDWYKTSDNLWIKIQ